MTLQWNSTISIIALLQEAVEIEFLYLNQQAKLGEGALTYNLLAGILRKENSICRFKMVLAETKF